MKTIKIPYELQKMNSIFETAGYEAFLVGGAVRDVIRGKKAADWDVATNAQPEQVLKIFRKVIPTGIAHGTVTVLFMNTQIEVTTYRTEADYSDGRHPDKISYAASIEEDLSRRDFTMNAIAVSLKTGEIVDPFDGQKDIKEKLIRTVGTATDRFEEDGLRPIRAIRFASQLNFKIDDATLFAIPQCLDVTKKVSIERFRDEFSKLLASEKPSVGLKLLEQTGILNFFIPELTGCRDVTQADARGFHCFDVLDHLFYACDGAPQDNEIVRLAALFHDIGKPDVRKEEEREINGEKFLAITFYNHEKVSAEKCGKILRRLRYSNDVIKQVVHLVSQHMFHYEKNWSDAAVRRFVIRVTPDALDDLFDLRLADVYGMTNSKPVIGTGPWSENLVELKDRIEKVISENAALGLKDLAVNGKDLIELGIPAGKAIGTILTELLEIVTDDPKMNDKEKLINFVTKKYLEKL